VGPVYDAVDIGAGRVSEEGMARFLFPHKEDEIDGMTFGIVDDLFLRTCKACIHFKRDGGICQERITLPEGFL